MDMETDTKDNLGIQSQSQPNSEGGEDNITLKVQDQGGDTVSFKIKRKTNLRKLMTAYCNKKNLDFKAVRFSYEGTRLRPDDCIMTIPDLEDGDTIDVFTEQQGGEGRASDGGQ